MTLGAYSLAESSLTSLPLHLSELVLEFLIWHLHLLDFVLDSQI